MKKRIISFLTAFVMMLSLMPQNIITVSAATFDSGAGTAAEPYIISTASQLEQIGGVENQGNYFKLNNDITVDENFKTIDAFYGVLNGNGKTISGVNITETITGTYFEEGTGTIAQTETKGRLFNTIEKNAVVYGLKLDKPTYTLKFGMSVDNHTYIYLKKGLFTNINRGIINGLQINSATMTTVTSEDDNTYRFWVGRYGVVAYQNTSTGKILNSDISSTMNISGGNYIGGIVASNSGIIANMLNTVSMYLKATGGTNSSGGNSMTGGFDYVSTGVYYNSGTMYNIRSSTQTYKHTDNYRTIDTKDCALFCVDNDGNIGKCSYLVYDKNIISDPYIASISTGTTDITSFTRLFFDDNENNAYTNFMTNSDNKLSEISGLKTINPANAYKNLEGMYFSEMWKDSTLLKRENHTISATQKLPYSLDTDYYCESWSVNGTQKNSGDSINITGNTKIVAQNVTGKYYLEFDGKTKDLATKVAIPQNYNDHIVWKQVGVDGTSVPNPLPTMNITMAKSTSTSIPGDDAFALPSTGTTDYNDKLWYKYTIPDIEGNYKFKPGTYNMYAEKTPSYKVEPIDVTTENYAKYFDVKINTEDTYRSDGNYGYTVNVKDGYKVDKVSLLYNNNTYYNSYSIPATGTYDVKLFIKGGNFVPSHLTSITIDTGLSVTINKDDPVLSVNTIDANLKHGETMQVTVDAKDRVSNSSFTDGTARLYLYPEGGSSSKAFYTSDDVTISETTTLPYTFNVNTLPNAGEDYVCEVYYKPASNNYNTKTSTQNFTVGKGTSAVKVSFDKEAYTYGEDVGIIVSGVPSDADESTLTLDDTSIEGAENITFIEKTESGDYKFKYANPQAGQRNIKVSFSGSGNYNGSADDKSVTVSKRALDATASAVKTTNYEYGETAEVKLNVGTCNSEAVSVSDLKLLVKNGETTVDTISIDETNLPITDKIVSLGNTLATGTYNLFVTIDDTTGNYTSPTAQCGTITIAKRTPTAADFSYTLEDNVQYSTLPDSLAITAADGVTGLGETITAKYKNAGAEEFLESKPVSLGNYELWAEVSEGTNINSGAVKLKDFTIIKKTITVDDMIIKINGEAPKASYPYTNKAPTVEITPKEEGAFTHENTFHFKWNAEEKVYEEVYYGMDFLLGKYKIQAYLNAGKNYTTNGYIDVAEYEVTKTNLSFAPTSSWKDSHTSSDFTKGDTQDNISKGIEIKSVFSYSNASVPVDTNFSAKLINTATGDKKDIKSIKIDSGMYCYCYINIRDVVGGQKYKCEITYSGCDYYYPITYTTPEFSIDLMDISFNASNTTQDYDGTEKQINVSTTPNYIPSEEITVNYYKVNEAGDALVSTTPVTPKEVGKYMYVLSISEERQAQCRFAKEQYTVASTAIPDFTAYCNVGLMTIRQGFTPAVWNDAENRYEISTKEQLLWFMEQVNNLDEFKDKNAILMNNIVLNDNVLVDGALNTDENVVSGFTAWTPIGSETMQYCGTFDGNNKTISGLYFNNTTTDNVGLFGYLGKGGNIKNVGIVDSYINASSNVGAVCGDNDGGTITGCYNKGIVNGHSFVGGVCGYNKGSGKLDNCYNEGAVTANTERAGGVCGQNSGTIVSCHNKGAVIATRQTGFKQYLGGVCGYNNGGTITGSYNEGTVTGKKYIGGVCGYNTGNGKIENCYTTKTSTVTNTVLDTDTEKVSSIGGVCGYNESGKITGSYNEGAVIISKREANYMGGVCGYNTGEVNSCYNAGEVKQEGKNFVHNSGGVCGYNGESAKIISCYNKGAVTSYGKFLGGVCGYNFRGKITDCYNEGTVTNTSSDDYIGGVCGENGGTIESCYNKGAVVGQDTNDYLGGVCGENIGTIKSCYNEGNISSDTGMRIGGVCGKNGGSIENCYNTGSVTADNCYIGGVCGQVTGEAVRNCYNTGTIICDATDNIGGAVGANTATVENVYYLENCNSDITTFDNTVGTSKTAYDFSCGAMAYLLNGEKSTGTLVWGQLLSGDANADKSPVHLTTNNAGTHTVYSGYNGCTAAYSNSELPTEPTHIKTNSFKCASCQKTLVNIKDFRTAYRKLPADWTQSVYVVNGTTAATQPKEITVKNGSGIITVYFKIDGEADLVESYTLTVKDSKDKEVQTVTSQCKSIFGNIGMAELVYTLPDGTYKVYVTLNPKSGDAITSDFGTIKEPADTSEEGSEV